MFGIIICYFGISNNTAACFGCGIATFYHKAMKKLCFAMEKGLPIFQKIGQPFFGRMIIAQGVNINTRPN